MKIMSFALMLTLWTASASAVEPDAPRVAETNGYSAQLYYRLEFGGTASRNQSVGLRFDKPGAAARNAPAVLQWSYGGRGAAFAVNGIELRGPSLSAAADDNGHNRVLGWFTPGEWAAIGGTVVVVALLLNHAGGDNGVAGTGGS